MGPAARSLSDPGSIPGASTSKPALLRAIFLRCTKSAGILTRGDNASARIHCSSAWYTWFTLTPTSVFARLRPFSSVCTTVRRDFRCSRRRPIRSTGRVRRCRFAEGRDRCRVRRSTRRGLPRSRDAGYRDAAPGPAEVCRRQGPPRVEAVQRRAHRDAAQVPRAPRGRCAAVVRTRRHRQRPCRSSRFGDGRFTRDVIAAPRPRAKLLVRRREDPAAKRAASADRARRCTAGGLAGPFA